MKIVEPNSGKRFARRNSRRVGQFIEDTRRAAVWHSTGRRRYTLEYATNLANQHDWCFLVGCNNSGTSLTQRILAHSDSVSSFALEGQRYSQALPRAVRRGHERVWTEFLDELRLTEKDALTAFPRLLHDWHNSLEKPVRSLILEKTTANVVRMRWLQSAFPKARFIVLVRDGYVVTEGIYRKGVQDIRRGARHWNKVYQIALEDSKYIRNLMFLRYEDLISDPATTAQRLSEFTGIPLTILKHGFEVKYGFNGATPQTAGVTDFNAQSRDRLTQADIEIIEAEAADMLAHFGY